MTIYSPLARLMCLHRSAVTPTCGLGPGILSECGLYPHRVALGSVLPAQVRVRPATKWADQPSVQLLHAASTNNWALLTLINALNLVRLLWRARQRPSIIRLKISSERF